MAHYRRKRSRRSHGRAYSVRWLGNCRAGGTYEGRFKPKEYAMRQAADEELRGLEAEFARMNQRRHLLLSREVSTGLTEEERAELARVEEWLHPVPLEYLRQIAARAGIVIEEEANGG